MFNRGKAIAFWNIDRTVKSTCRDLQNCNLKLFQEIVFVVYNVI